MRWLDYVLDLVLSHWGHSPSTSYDVDIHCSIGYQKSESTRKMAHDAGLRRWCSLMPKERAASWSHWSSVNQAFFGGTLDRYSTEYILRICPRWLDKTSCWYQQLNGGNGILLQYEDFIFILQATSVVIHDHLIASAVWAWTVYVDIHKDTGRGGVA